MAQITPTMTELGPREPRERERTRRELAGAGGIAEGLAAATTVVLAILALARVLPYTFLSIACIAAGAALIFEGGAVAARASRILSSAMGRGDVETSELEGGIAAEALAGAAGVVLGILALIGTSPVVLTAVAAIVFGAGMLFGSGARSKLSSFQPEPLYATTTTERVTRVAQQSVFVSAGGEVLVGVAAIVLGIIALLGIAPMTLTLVALLAIGGSLLLSGAAIGTRMLSVVRA